MPTNLSRAGARACAAFLVFASMASTVVSAAPAIARHPAATRPANPLKTLYTQTLADGSTATVYANRLAMIVGKNERRFEVRYVPANIPIDDHKAVAVALLVPRQPVYAPRRVLIVFAPGRAPLADTVDKKSIDATLAGAGVDGLQRIAATTSRSRLEQMHALAMSAGASSSLDLANAYVAHLDSARVLQAVAALRRARNVAYVEPDWTVSTLAQPRATLTPSQMARARQHASPFGASVLPTNYALTASAQPILSATADDAISAYDLIARRFGELPGHGETVTNVSIGDITDWRSESNFKDPCQFTTGHLGPTSHLIGKQHYLDLPSMPLIPVYVADPNGVLSGDTEACGTGDPYDTEIDLDFSMMAPLPHDLQRGGEVGSGYTDLLGVAPGAQYRLVAPATPYISNIIAAFIAAAAQTPAPNVITASLGFGFDTRGFPGRFLEDDPLVESAVATIVKSQNIVVTLASNDGTRAYTNVAIGPTGGSTATDRASDAARATVLDDLMNSTAPSRDVDSGAIAVGGTTTNDIFAIPPKNATATAIATVAETRYTGFTSFSSGYGDRLELSAPSDNMLAFQHALGTNYDGVDVELEGGTSASAPQVAAAAAVALQVARLTGHPFTDAAAVRKALIQAATPVTAIPQEDQAVNVGRQIDVGRVVASLIAKSGRTITPSVAHLSIMQRNSATFDDLDSGGIYATDLDAMFTSDTDPNNIDLQGPADAITNRMSGLGMDEYLTIAPDWEGIPSNARYQLSVQNGTRNVAIATTPAARLLPQTLFAAAGLGKVSSASRTLKLVYSAIQGARVLASVPFSLTFGPSLSYSERVFAPSVAPVITGPTMRVDYDLRDFPQSLLSSAELIVSHPGRVNPETGGFYAPDYQKPLLATTGSIEIPVSELQGDGIYGVGILLNGVTGLLSDFAYTRVQSAQSHVRAPAPEFVPPSGVSGSPSHYLEIPYGGTVHVAYDVSSVPGATGALLEVSAAGPTIYGNYNTVNNPNGSIVDANGTDFGSLFTQVLSGTKGTISLNAAQLNVIPTLGSVVRVIPMSGNVAAGEASDVSYLLEDGVVPPDGGTLEGGFSINTNSTDGAIASNQPLADGEWSSSLYSFDQKTMAVENEITHRSGGYDWYDLAVNGMYEPDMGLARSEANYEYIPTGFVAPSPAPPLFSSIPKVATATALGSAWTPQLASATTDVIGAGTNSTDGAAAFLLHDNGAISNAGLAAFTSNIGTNTFSKEIDLTSLTGSFGWRFAGFDYDSGTHEGYVVSNVSFFGRASTSIVRIDFHADHAGIFAPDPWPGAIDFVVDPIAHVAFMSSLSSGHQLQLIDLKSKNFGSTNVPAESLGTTFVRVAADPEHHLYFAQAPLSPDAGSNNNSLSTVYVLNSQGQQIEALEQFNFWLEDIFEGAHYFRVNGNLRRGFAFGPDDEQLEPFDY